MVTLSPMNMDEPVACFSPNTTERCGGWVGCGGWVSGWVGGWLWYDKQATSSSAKSLSVRTSVAIISNKQM